MKTLWRFIKAFACLFMGLFLGTGLYVVLTADKVAEGVGFGILVGLIGCPMMLWTSYKYFTDKDYKLD